MHRVICQRRLLYNAELHTFAAENCSFYPLDLSLMPNRFRYLLLALAFQVISMGHSFAQNDDCTGDEDVRFFFENQSPVIGGSIFIDITISAVQDVEFIQIPITWDPLLLEYLNCDVVVPVVQGFTCDNLSVSSRENGVIRILWLHPDGVSSDIAQDAVIATLEFRVIGISSDPTSVSITPEVDGFEFNIGSTDPDSPNGIGVDDFCQVGNFFDIGCTTATAFPTPCGGNDPGSGSLRLQVCGGQAPYNARVVSASGQNIPTDPIPDENGELLIENLNPGESYSVNITDSAPTPNVIFNESVQINIEESLQSSIVLDNPNLAALGELLCFAGPRQTTSLTVEVFPLPSAQNVYFYNWEDSNGQFVSGSDVAQNVGAGSYMVTVTDSITGCNTISQFDLKAPDPITYAIDGPFAPACPDSLAVGSVTLNIEGGRPQADNVVGAYRVRLEDTESSNFIEGVSKADGSITFSYQNRREQGLLAGTSWNLIVDDEALGFPGNCPSDTSLVVVPNPESDAIGYQIRVQDTLTGCDGTADVVFIVSPPPPDPTQDLSDNFTLFDLNGDIVDLDDKKILASGDIIRDIPPGSYTFEYQVPEDPCNGTGAFTVVLAPTLDVDPNSLIPMANCGSAVIDIMPTGGTGQYRYRWSDTRTTTDESRRDDLLPDTDYFLTITDSGGCELIPPDPINIQNIDGLSISQDSILSQGPGCGQTTGFVQLSISPTDTNNYILLIDGRQENGTMVDNLDIGDYELTVQLAGNATCIAGPFDVSIMNDAGIAITQNDLSIEPIDCDGTLGSITLPPTTGAQGDYFLKFVEVGSTDTTEIRDRFIENIEGGDYILIAAFENSPGCSIEFDNIVFEDKIPLIVDESSLEPSKPGCATEFGAIAVRVTGGAQPYSFIWSNGMTIDTTDNPVKDDLVSETSYNLTITDSAGCSYETSNPIPIVPTRLDELFDINEDSLKVIPIPCGGEFGGFELSLLPTDTNEYIITNGVIESDPGMPLQGLPAGDHGIFLKIVGKEECQSEFFSKFISPPQETNLTLVESIGPKCSGTGNDGSIELAIDGITNNVTFTWSDGFSDTSLRREGLGMGTYSVIVSNTTGCSDTLSDIVLDLELEADFPEILTREDATCRGAANGIIEFEDPNNIFEFTWSDNDNGTVVIADRREDLIGDQEYTVVRTIEGNTMCSDNMAITIQTVGRVIVSFTDIIQVPPTCTGGLGSITIPDNIVTNGIAPYIYNIETIDGMLVATDDDITDGEGSLDGISAGNYIGMITDSVGCESNFPLIMDDGIPINIPDTPQTITNPSCAGDANGSYSITASGGSTGTFDFNWSTGESDSGIASTSTSLSAGDQFVVISDGVCPPDTTFFNVPDGEVVTLNSANTNVEDIDCFGETTGLIQLDVIGQINDYVFEWADFPTETSNRLTNLGSGDYAVTITNDLNGCETDTTFTVVSPDELQLTIDELGTMEISCRNPQGTISVDTRGGTGDYNYDWSNDGSITGTVVDDLAPDVYMITVTDELGCIDSTSFELVAEQPIFFEVSDYDPISCAGETTNISVTNIEGGVAPYRFSIIDGGQLFDDTTGVNVGAGSYTFNIFDADGCQASMKITEDLTEPSAPMISLGQDTTIDLGEAYRLIPDIISEAGVDSINYFTEATVTPITGDGVAIRADRDVTVMVQLVDQDGCIATDELQIKVKKSRKVYIPNIVITNPSPAAVSSGEVNFQNTKFSVFTGIGVTQVLSMQVFDRWGTIVYEALNLPANSQDVGIGNWNGTFEGDRVATGVYGYLIKVEFTDGQILNYKGDVTVIN